MTTAQSCPPESPPRLYHPRPLVKLGGLGECSAVLNSFDKAAWYAGSEAGSDQLGVLGVNVHGENVGTEIASSVSAEGSRGHYAAILGLAGDFNRDWAVGSPDLAMLLSSWGSTTSMELDLSQDGSVNSPDLTALLSLWTGSAQRALALSCGAEFCLPEGESLAERTEGSPDDALAHALAAFGFESVDAFRAAAIELDEAQLDFTCHAMHCFMQAYSENLQ